jgi:hypothetical protein
VIHNEERYEAITTVFICKVLFKTPKTSLGPNCKEIKKINQVKSFMNISEMIIRPRNKKKSLEFLLQIEEEKEI